jgi:hypothetical protein
MMILETLFAVAVALAVGAFIAAAVDALDARRSRKAATKALNRWDEHFSGLEERRRLPTDSMYLWLNSMDWSPSSSVLSGMKWGYNVHRRERAGLSEGTVIILWRELPAVEYRGSGSYQVVMKVWR